MTNSKYNCSTSYYSITSKKKKMMILMFMMMLTFEMTVSMIQSYVFTMLSTMYSSEI